MKTDPLADLLQVAGPRAGVPVERARRVEQIVRAEWRQVVKRRSDRRRAALAAATGLVSAAVMALMFQSYAHSGTVHQPSPSPTVSQTRPVAERPRLRYDGSYYRASGEDRMPDRGLPRHVLASYAEAPR